MAAEERLVEAPEQGREPVAPELLRLRHGEQFDEEAGKLDQPIVRAPRMLVARSNNKAEPAIQLVRRVEIAHRMDDMVEAARHYCPPVVSHNKAWFSNHNRPGLSSPLARAQTIERPTGWKYDRPPC